MNVRNPYDRGGAGDSRQAKDDQDSHFLSKIHMQVPNDKQRQDSERIIQPRGDARLSISRLDGEVGLAIAVVAGSGKPAVLLPEPRDWRALEKGYEEEVEVEADINHVEDVDCDAVRLLDGHL